MTASAEARHIAKVAVEAAEDKLGQDILVLDVSDKLGIADIFVVITGNNERQVGAIVEHIERRLLAAGRKPLRREGNREDPWVLLDYFDTVVHVQHTEARRTYALDRLWHDCPTIDLSSNSAVAAATTAAPARVTENSVLATPVEADPFDADDARLVA